jgi:tRNA A64-2'-O-ribosylphosphate transferase
MTISCVSKSEVVSQEMTIHDSPQRLQLVCVTGKVGSRQLRHELPKLEQLIPIMQSTSKILVTCQTGKDLAVGVALALLCRAFDDNGKVRAPDNPYSMTKSIIKQRLSWIMVSMPDAAPSRATLQSVNHFLG